MPGLRILLVIAFALVPALLPGAAAAKRVALVVGNGAYDEAAGMPALPNADEDGRAMAAALRPLGFEVIEAIDADNATLLRALRDFGQAAIGADIALFFFAGHGLQVNGENYLLPIGAVIETQRDLEYETLSLSQVKRELEFAGANLGMLILDACRNNPLSRSLARRMQELGRSIEADEGLARVAVGDASGMLIAYATAPGDVALDGTGPNSPFTTALVQHLADPGVDVRVMFGRVRGAVVAATNGAQTPWVEEAVLGEFALNPLLPAPAAEPPPAVAEMAPPPVSPGREAVELSFWQAVQSIAVPAEKVAALEDYLARYPDGTFASLARIQISSIRTTLAASAALPPEETRETAPAPTEIATLPPAPEQPAPPAVPDREMVREIQVLLAALAFDAGAADGIVGPRTRLSIIAFQQKRGLAETGEPTPELLAALRAEAPAVQVPAVQIAAAPPPAMAEPATVELWFRAFIPERNDSDPRSVLQVPGRPGMTMVPGPIPYVSDCFLTAQRGFSLDPAAAASIAAYARIEVGPVPTLAESRFLPNEAVEVDCEDGDVECRSAIHTARSSIGPVAREGDRLRLYVHGAAGNPCSFGSPDYRFDGQLVVDLASRTAWFEGSVGGFPAFEALGRFAGGNIVAILQTGPAPGTTAFHPGAWRPMRTTPVAF